MQEFISKLGTKFTLLKAHDQVPVHKHMCSKMMLKPFHESFEGIEIFRQVPINMLYTSQHGRIFRSVRHYSVVHLSPFLLEPNQCQ